MAHGVTPAPLSDQAAATVPPKPISLSTLFGRGMLDRYVRPFSYLLTKAPHWRCRNSDGVELDGCYVVSDGRPVKIAICRDELDAAVICEALRTWSIHAHRGAVGESRTPPPSNPEQVDVT